MSKVPFEHVEQTARLLANLIDKMLREECDSDDRRWQFILHVVQAGPEGLTTYVSNCHREDAIRMMQEWLEHQKTSTFTSTDIGKCCYTCGAKGTVAKFTGRYRTVHICGACMNSQEADHL